MKKLFTAIRKKDNETVKALIEKKPELVNCTAKQPPKKGDGQSPLQVALKSGNFEIAEYLINNGADVNFIEDESCANDWRMPALHDAITAAVMCCRHNSRTEIGDKLFFLRSIQAGRRRTPHLRCLSICLKLAQAFAQENPSKQPARDAFAKRRKKFFPHIPTVSTG